MRKNPILGSILLLASISLPLLPTTNQFVRAQTPPPLPFQYAVKFICGTSPTGQFQVVARGTYFTAINIHNPLVGKVNFRKKLAIATPGEELFVTRFSDTELPADGAMDFSCRDIAKLLNVTFASFETGTRRRFLKGFVVIESRTELDVVAVYTTGSSSVFNGRVDTMTLERVPARRLAQADLIPVPDANGTFCKRDAGGRLIVTVKNQGTADADASITRIDFATGENQSVTTPAIQAGGSVDVLVTFPAACFRPDCTFRIAVDSTGVVSESNEGNNAAGGTCGS
jgi:CARDB protein